jgi:hypothetical protein
VIAIIVAVVFFVLALLNLVAIIGAPTLVNQPRKPLTAGEVGARVLVSLIYLVLFLYAGIHLLHE